MVVKANAPIADAKTEFGWMNAAESLDVAGTGQELGRASQR
jgi:hypothetical protein